MRRRLKVIRPRSACADPSTQSGNFGSPQRLADSRHDFVVAAWQGDATDQLGSVTRFLPRRGRIEPQPALLLLRAMTFKARAAQDAIRPRNESFVCDARGWSGTKQSATDQAKGQKEPTRRRAVWRHGAKGGCHSGPGEQRKEEEGEKEGREKRGGRKWKLWRCRSGHDSICNLDCALHHNQPIQIFVSIQTILTKFGGADARNLFYDPSYSYWQPKTRFCGFGCLDRIGLASFCCPR